MLVEGQSACLRSFSQADMVQEFYKSNDCSDCDLSRNVHYLFISHSRSVYLIFSHHQLDSNCVSAPSSLSLETGGH